jgi:hypothetical protein
MCSSCLSFRRLRYEAGAKRSQRDGNADTLRVSSETLPSKQRRGVGGEEVFKVAEQVVPGLSGSRALLVSASMMCTRTLRKVNENLLPSLKGLRQFRCVAGTSHYWD